MNGSTATGTVTDGTSTGSTVTDGAVTGSTGTPGLTAPDRLFAGYAFDLDGTVYLGDEALPGAVGAIRRLRDLGCRVVFVTNKPLQGAPDYAAKLTGLGVPCRAEEVITATDTLLEYLEVRHPGSRIFPVTETAVQDALRAAGHQLTADPAAAEVVVVAFDRTFDYAKLTAAYRAVRLHGAALVATNPDPYCPTPDGGLPDCAAMLAAVEACTGVCAEAVAGKPSVHMAGAILARLDCAPADIAMVGDRLATDMAMASRAGMAGVLVLSGATGADDLESSGIRPRYAVSNLSQLLPAAVRQPAPASQPPPASLRQTPSAVHQGPPQPG